MSIKNHNNGNAAENDQDINACESKNQRGSEDLEQPSTSSATKETVTKRKCEEPSTSGEPAKRKRLELPDLLQIAENENKPPVIQEAAEIVDPGPIVEENANDAVVLQPPVENQQIEVPEVVEEPNEQEVENKIVITISDDDDEEDDANPPPYYFNHPDPENWEPIELFVDAEHNPPYRPPNVFERRMDYAEMFRRYNLFREHQLRLVNVNVIPPPANIEELQPIEADDEEPLVCGNQPPLNEEGQQDSQGGDDPDLPPLNVDEQQLANLEDQPPALDIDHERLPPMIQTRETLGMPDLNLEIQKSSIDADGEQSALNLDAESSSTDFEQEEPLVIIYGDGQQLVTGFSQASVNVDEYPPQVSDDDHGPMNEDAHQTSMTVAECKPSTSQEHQPTTQNGGPIRLVKLSSLLKPEDAEIKEEPEKTEDKEHATDSSNDGEVKKQSEGDVETADNKTEAPLENESNSQVLESGEH